MKAWYLDQDVFSNLAKRGSEQLRARLLAALHKSGGSLAVSFTHLMELARATGLKKAKDGTVSFLPNVVSSAYANFPILRMASPTQIYDDEFINAYQSNINGTQPAPLEVFGHWEWMPNGGTNATLLEAIAFVALHQSGLDSIHLKNAEFRQSVKDQVGEGASIRHKTLEDSLQAERAAISESIARTEEFWPRSPLAISPATKKSHRLNYLRQFDFSACPALNLFVGLAAHQRHAILNEAIKKGDLTDQNGAAIGGQYCIVYISKDAAILRALEAVKNLTPYKAKVFSSIEDALEVGPN